MAALIKLKCKNCGNVFQSLYGDLGKSLEFRCEDCDKNTYLRREKEEEFSKEGVLNKKCECGGLFKRGLKPKCPNCESRDLKELKLLAFLD